MRNSRKTRLNCVNEHHQGTWNSKSTGWEGTEKQLIHFFKFKVSCNSSGEIPGCGLLYIADSLIRISTVNRTEQKVSMYRNGQLCWNNHNALPRFPTLNTVFTSHPLIEIKHTNNLRGREKKVMKEASFGFEKCRNSCCTEKVKWTDYLCHHLAHPSFTQTPKETGILRERKVCHVRTFYLLPNLTNILIHYISFAYISMSAL